MQIGPAFATRDPAPGTLDAESPRGLKLFGDDGLSFRDVLDLVNPLQHIPVVGNLYRKLTGDAIDPAIRIAGGALFGGPLGAVLSVGSMLIERGRDADAALPVLQDKSSALAAGHGNQPYRGGWMVNAAMTGQLSQFVPSPAPATEAIKRPSDVADVPHPEVRRGGWMVIQAYALSDLQPEILNTIARRGALNAVKYAENSRAVISPAGTHSIKENVPRV